MKKILFLVSVLILSTTNGFAWGKKGHSIVAEIAFHNLDAKTKQNVLNYLNGMSIEDAANWMDSMRSDKSFNFMKPYHYIDFEKGSEVTELSGDNIISILNKTLKDLDNIKTLSNDEVRTKLFYLFHLIGDLHQPLHVGYNDDKGGNTVQVSFFGKGSNLHAEWDSDIIEYKGLTLDEVLKINAVKDIDYSSIKKIDVLAWAKESRLYLKNVYDFKGAKVTDEYIDSNYPIIKHQLLYAGIRLAAVLEHYFKNVTYIANPNDTKKVVEDIVETSINIDVAKSAEYEGKLVYTCGKVYSSKVLDSNGMILLNVGAEYPDSPLTIVIYADKLKNFDFKPNEYYKGKNICVSGKIKMYKGKPEIIINTQHAIQVK